MLIDNFYNLRQQGKKGLAVLIDPDKAEINDLKRRVDLASKGEIDFFFLGGSMVSGAELGEVISYINANSNIPVVLFPGSPLQLHADADAVLFLSLISGRNPEYLIGNHVIAAPYLKKMQVEVLPTGYMLVDGGLPTTASYISSSSPLPNNKPAIAAATALAGEMLGLKLLYLDAGSGAAIPVSGEMIKAVRTATNCPLIVGGGIQSSNELADAYKSGADVAVVGNAIERDPELIKYLAEEKSRI